jgi:hypothetical protein
MGVSAKEAAELVGMSKAGILKAIKTGKVSAAKDLNGEWRIEPVELFRVYEPVSANVHTQMFASPQPSQHQHIPESIASLQRELNLLHEMIADLRARLDAESEERRRLSLILTDKEQDKARPASNPKGFWARLLGGREQ